MARSTVKDLTAGSPMRLVLQFTAPLLFGIVFQQLYSFVDTAIVGRYLGSEALAAVGSTGSLNFLILGFCMGICSGCAIPVAQAFGAKDEEDLRRCAVHCVYVGAAIAAVMAVAFSLLCPALLRLTNTPEDIMEDAVGYLQLIFMAIPVTVLYNMSSGVMRSLGDSKTPVYFLALASLVNIALDLMLILWCRMGVQGAAVATVVSQLFAGAGCLLVLMRRFPILRLRPGDRAFRPAYAVRLMNMGIPMGLQYSITAVGSVVVQTAVNGLGTVAVAAVAAGGKVSQLFSCVYDALATTIATFAGQNMGAKKLNRIHQGLKSASIIGMIYSVAALVVILLLGRAMVSLFVDAADDQVIERAYQFMVVNGVMYIPLLFVNLVRFAIQGMGFTRVAVFAGVAEMIARTLVAMCLVPIFGFDAACWANPAAWIFADAFLFPCYFHIMKKLRHRLYPAGEQIA